MYRQKKAWGPYLRNGNGTILCYNMVHNKRIFENLMYNGQLHAGNFAEINYDHWMNNIWGTIVQLYTFLNVQLSTETVKKIQVIFIFQTFISHSLRWAPWAASS